MEANEKSSRLLMQLGAVLFLIGLLIGFMAPQLASPRMGVTSHLEGVMNGPFLIIAGLIWGRLSLGPKSRKTLFYLLLYGTYANVLSSFLAAYWPAGGTMPINYKTPTGTETQEQIILFLLFSCAIAIVIATLQIIWGLRGRDKVI